MTSKSELVTKLSAQIKPFLTADGVFKADFDLPAFATLMNECSSNSNRALTQIPLLSILLSNAHERTVQCVEIMRVLHTWLQEGIKEDNKVIVTKILEVSHKMGKEGKDSEKR